MKKIYLSLIAVLAVCQITCAQWTPGTGIITTPNNVGIGTTSPISPLDVAGSWGAFNSSSHVISQFVQDHTNNRGIYLGYDNSGQIGVIASNSTGAASNLAFWNWSGTSWFEAMRLTSTGNLGIGTTTPDQKLTVKGTIHSQAVIVDNNFIPDYVFKTDYKLVSLRDVKAYIDKNHHLPEMPSAKTVARKGLNLGEMNTLLLKKSRRLTLYTIDSDNRINEDAAIIKRQTAIVSKLQDRLLNQQDEIDQLKKQIEAITKTFDKNNK